MIIGCISAAISGMLIASMLSMMPGVNMMLIATLIISCAGNIVVSDPHYSLCFAAGAMTGYLFISLIPAVLLSSPDDSTVFISRYGTRLSMCGRGREAVLLCAIGTLIGVFIACASAVFFMDRIFLMAERFQEHSGWIGWSVLFILVASLRFSDMTAGMVTIALSGLVGFAAFGQDIQMGGIAGIHCFPVIAGLFAAPSLLLNTIFGGRLPEQGHGVSDISGSVMVKSTIYGMLWGTISALMPFCGAGAGSLLADRSMAGDERAKLVALGAVRPVYCFAVLFLAFNCGIPFLQVTGRLSVIKGEPLYLGGACVMLSAVMAVILVNLLLEKATLFSGSFYSGRIRKICLIGLILVVIASSGLSGLAVFVVSVAVGMIPPLFGLSRIYCIAALIVSAL